MATMAMGHVCPADGTLVTLVPEEGNDKTLAGVCGVCKTRYDLMPPVHVVMTAAPGKYLDPHAYPEGSSVPPTMAMNREGGVEATAAPENPASAQLSASLSASQIAFAHLQEVIAKVEHPDHAHDKSPF